MKAFEDKLGFTQEKGLTKMKTFKKNQKVRVKDFVRLKDVGVADTVIETMNYLVTSHIVDNNCHIINNVAFNKFWNGYYK